MSRPDVTAGYDLVVAANWLPVKYDHGRPQWRDRAGSTAATLASAVAERRGAWIGWSGAADRAPEAPIGDLWLHPVALAKREIEDHYHGHCLNTLAPLYHDCGVNAQFRRPWEETYREVNLRFARTAARLAAPDATVWVHDHHLQLVPGYLRQLRTDLRIGFFLHGLLPPAERFMQQPLRRQIMHGLLGADLVGFQQPRSADTFMDLAADLAGLRQGDRVVHHGGRDVRVGTFPASVDAAGIEALAADPDVRERAAGIRESLGNPRLVLLSVGPSTAAEGIDRRLDAYAQLLAERHLDSDDVVLVHIAACGDEHGTEHEDHRHRVDRHVAQINGVRSRVGRPAIHYLRHELDRAELVAFYLAADIMLAVPLRQGMTLTAKEFVASRTDDTGQLLLSEFSGAANDLPEAMVVNPHDVDALKDAILLAASVCHSRSDAMCTMRQRVRNHDGPRWAREFLTTLTEPAAQPRPIGTRSPVSPHRPVLTEDTFA